MNTERSLQGYVIWFTGLPGCGKSSLAKAVLRALRERGRDVEFLQMDKQRKKYFPDPQYTNEERQAAYRLFAQEGAELATQGKGVILDGTAYKRSMREYARFIAPRFCEIYVRCPVEVAKEREAARPEGQVMAGLYEKALERKRTGKEFEGLGEVVGIDVQFEEDPAAECVIPSDTLSIEEGRDKVLEFLDDWLPEKE